jgi:hypothetical protein
VGQALARARVDRHEVFNELIQRPSGHLIMDTGHETIVPHSWLLETHLPSSHLNCENEQVVCTQALRDSWQEKSAHLTRGDSQ